MAEIMVGEQVKNKASEMGKIISVNKGYIQVQFGNRAAKFLHDAFEKGVLVYTNTEFQNKIDELIEQNKMEERRKAAEREGANSIVQEEDDAIRRLFEQPTGVVDEQNIRFEAVTTRLEAADVHLNSVAKKHKDLVQAVFKECDKDTQELYDCFQPKMEYPKYTSQSRSRY